jgi:putative thioredoxin
VSADNVIFDAGEADFDERVVAASRARIVVADFWAEWCPPCRVLTPILEKVVVAYDGEVALARIEVDDNMRLAGRYQLRGFPTVLLFQDGEIRDRFSGAQSAGFVRDFIDRHLRPPAAGRSLS